MTGSYLRMHQEDHNFFWPNFKVNHAVNFGPKYRAEYPTYPYSRMVIMTILSIKIVAEKEYEDGQFLNNARELTKG